MLQSDGAGGTRVFLDCSSYIQPLHVRLSKDDLAAD